MAEESISTECADGRWGVRMGVMFNAYDTLQIALRNAELRGEKKVKLLGFANEQYLESCHSSYL